MPRRFSRATRLAPKDRKAVVAKLARYTGLSADYIERTDLAVEIFRFCKELLRDEQRTVGRLDSRFTGRDRDAPARNSNSIPRWWRSTARMPRR
jgi:carboxypeptidase C (cathepsin A)